MNILLVIDKLEFKYFEFNDLITDFWIIKNLLQKKHNVFVTTINNLSLISGKAYCNCAEAYMSGDNNFEKQEVMQNSLINDFELVLFRPDPPVDIDYINSTYIFDYVDNKKTLVINNPSAVRNFNEKLHTTLFLDLMPENIVTSRKNDIIKFLNEHSEIILKPLNQCFGGGVMYLKKGDNNTSVIINSVTKNESTLVMVQNYIPKAKLGDKRVLTLGDEVLDFCVQKLPSNYDFKFNEHCDKNIIKAELTSEEKEKYTEVAKKLNSMGMPLVGLDVIDGKIIEINVTSPCYFIREINRHFGCHLEDKLTDYILNLVSVKV